MRLNEFGRIVQEEWLRAPILRPSAAVDSFIVMPNHCHGILVHADEQRPASCGEGKYGKPVTGSVGAIIGQFKAAVTKRINRVRGTPTAQVWQRNYFDRIIRTEDELNLTRHYIEGNPAHRPDFH
jgi:REP element-mobilizing transposase RayT